MKQVALITGGASRNRYLRLADASVSWRDAVPLGRLQRPGYSLLRLGQVNIPRQSRGLSRLE